MIIRLLSIIRLTAVLFLITQLGRAQIHPTGTTRADTMKVVAAETLATPRVPLLLVGSIDRSLPRQNILIDSIVNFTDYRYLGDLLWSVPGAFIRDFGTPGQWQQLSIAGVEPRSVQFLSDGIPLNDSYSGLFDLYLYPTENIERIERVTGTRAFLYGLNSTGGTINLVTKSRKAIHSYSRIRYSESGYGYSFIDGMFSQDIIRGLNLTAGIFHHSFGGRFSNSNYDQWNGRTKLRYNISNTVNLFASEMYNQTYCGLWGGVDTATLPAVRFDRLRATIRNPDAYEKLARHDVQGGIAAKLFADTNAISTLTLFYSTQLREYRDEENRPSPNGIFIRQDQDSRWYGARFQHEQSIHNQRLTIGGEVVTRRVLISPATNALEKTQLAVFGKADFTLGTYLTVSPFVRFENYLGYTRLSHGGDATITPLPQLQFFGGYARSYRFLTFQEFEHPASISIVTLSGYSPAAVAEAPERHELFEGGFRWNNEHCYSFELRLFHRTIRDAMTLLTAPQPIDPNNYAFSRYEKVILRGAAGNTSLRFGSFVLEGEVQYLDYVNDDDPARTLPQWSAGGGIFFWDTLAGGHLNLKIGLRGRAFSSYVGREFNTLALAYVPNGQETLVDAAGTADFFLVAHLGDAYIHLIMENLFDRQYIMNSFYPMLDRSLRFGVSWEFAD
ncbi:MAG: TonB-dependent receptor [Ignavibacteriae bacterium]|nr:TonB-dependent receptor [Ignavibacteria bacterium]MBI3365061.1 TonB-dependent receptor [Ignavibacteriota bacterium]